MGALIKLLFGAILMVASVWWVVQGSELYNPHTLVAGKPGLNDLITLLNGGVPLGLFFIGIFVIWLELDEIKIEREIKAEEKKSKKR